jgi:malate permease and related proteins
MQTEILAKLFEVIFPVFFIIGMGYVFGKKNPNFDSNVITGFAGSVGVPCLLFYSLTLTNLDFDVFVKFAGITLLCIGLFALMGVLLLLVLKRNILKELPPIILPNMGNMGLAFCLFAYGPEGFSIASAIASMIMILHFTVNIFLAKGKFTIEPLLKSVPLYVMVIAATFLYFKIPVPKFVTNTTMLVGYTALVLVLTSLGIALSTLKKVSIQKTLIISFVRLVGGPVVSLGVIKFFGLTGYQAGVLFVQCSMPAAVLTYLLAKMYSPKEQADNIASVIAVSTLISIVTIPIVIYIALTYFV